MPVREWIFKTIDRERQDALSRALSISPVTASMLLGRGVGTMAEARRWLTMTSESPHDPMGLPDMAVALERLRTAVERHERICFYGDYDVDGISSTSLFLSYFGGLGANVCSYIPHRIREGYGLNEAAVRRLRADGVSLLVTSDCGSTSFKEIEIARGLGLDIIVTDHHQVGGQVPPAFAVINPCRSDSSYPFTGLCSAALAFKVVQAYRQAWRPDDPPVDSFLDLVALATIADIVPMVDENRVFVREGLSLMTGGARCGLRALKVSAGIGGPCSSGIVAFRLAPRINAAGRVGHAETGVQLLTTESEFEAKRLADHLDALNRERQGLEERATREAVEMVTAEGGGSGAIVVWSKAWHLGVVGITAARLVERFNRPAIVATILPSGVAKGSVRTVAGVDVYRALQGCAEVLEAFGGHPSAAGVTLREDLLPALRERFSRVVGEATGLGKRDPVLHVDAEVALQDVTQQLVRELELFHPFGPGNPEPTLAVKNLTILQSRVVGESHLKLTVRHGNSQPFDGIGFRMGSLSDRGLSLRQPVDLAFIPEVNRWNGLERIQLRVRDLRASQAL
ncbi:MAG: single-stranded-DNA-specific exonuclease RecJ [Nitrospira sp.]|nr:MAG: single-stranded-DNA-specific exonuclease RecJ [Nitrospira sp.]